MSNYFAIAKKHQFACLPLQNNSKKPATKNGCTDATTDLASLSSWAGNIGIEAQRSNLILIDLDNKDGRDGYSKWKEYQKQHGRTSTLAATTPSGGIHLYYRRPKGFDALKLQNVKDHPAIGAGIEIRHTNQYLVAPPSVIDGKCYEWIEPEAEIAECPQWVITMMTEATIGPVKTGWDKITLPTGYQYSAKDIIEKYNSSHKIEDVLTAHGYVTAKDGWMRYPGENTPSVHIIGENKSYHFGAGDPLQGKGYGTDKCCIFPFDVVVHLDYASDYKKAVREISVSLSMDGKSRKVDIDQPPAETTSNIVWLSDVQERTITWLWQDRIPLGCLTLISGTGGVNKSTIMYSLAARLSVGEPFPLTTGAITGKTIIVSGEDDPQTIIRPRLRIAGANLSSIGILDIREIVNGERKKKRFTLTDLTSLEAAIKSAPDVKLVIIDPVGSFGGKANGDKQFDVMQITSSLNDLAAKHNIAIVACQHLNKSAAGGARGLRDRLMGSAGWFDGSRSVFLVTLDKANPERRCLSHGKANHSKLQEAIGFEVVVHTEDSNQIISLKWDSETTVGTADEFLVETTVQGEDVETWLRQQLESHGEVNVSTLKTEGQSRGIDYHRIWRASEKLNVKRRKEGFSPGIWFWSLPTAQKSQNVEDPYSDGRSF